MIRKFFVFFFSLLSIYTLSQEYNTSLYSIRFIDKGKTGYSLDNPAAFLSQRAIERRQKFSINISESDLPVNPDYIEKILGAGATVVVSSKWLNEIIISADPFRISLEEIKAFPFVDQVEDVTTRLKIRGDILNTKTHKTKPFFQYEHLVPASVSVYKSDYGMNVLDYGDSYNQINQINGIGLHNAGFTGEGMVIAVLDAGFNMVDQLPAFDSLWVNNRILSTRNYVTPGQSVFGWNDHGTTVLSLMGGNLPGVLVGTAPDASYYLIRTEDGSAEYLLEEYYWIQGAEYADSVGADVINSSLGYTIFDNPEENHTYEDMDGNTTAITIAADIAASKGILVCNSAGNYADNPWLYMGAPADGDSVFSIGAVDAFGNYASFSSIGPTSDGRLKPDVVAQGQGTVIAVPWGGISTGSGTSFSSPIIAGMSACLWQAKPDFNNIEIMHAIEQSASMYDDPNCMFGYGIPDYVKANNILGIIQFDNDFSVFNVKVFPNPFFSGVTIEFSSDKNQNIGIQLLSSIGQSVFSGKISAHYGDNNYQINRLENFPSGIYILRITTAERELRIKTLKSNL